MTQSVELLLDEASDAAVRRSWDALVTADLPSQARHRGATNRPHVTLAVRRQITAEQDAALDAVVARLPLSIRLDGVLLLGGAGSRRGLVLVRPVVVTRALLLLQEHVTQLLGEDPVGGRLFEPGGWTPHVTLARGLQPDQVERAVLQVADGETVDAVLPAARRWDSDRSVAWLLGTSPRRRTVEA